MEDVRPELAQKWAKTEGLTRDVHADLISHVESVVDLFRSAFNNLSASQIRDEAHSVRVLLFNVSAAALEAGYVCALYGYYQPAGAAARMLLEHLANLMYFEKHPEQAHKALDEPTFNITVRNALEGHPDAVVGASLATAYAELSRVAHPYQLSKLLGVSGDKLRVSSFDAAKARSVLYYLADISVRVAGYIREEVEVAGANKAWLLRHDQVKQDWLAWRAKA